MRPTSYTPEIGDEICSLLADGVPLSRICKEERFPSSVTVYAWLRKHPEFLSNYTRAREDQADTQADEIVAIDDDGTNDTYKNEDGIELVNHDVIARSRLRVEARKWVAAKLKPKKYGDRVDLTHANPDGGPVQFQQIERKIVRPAD